MSDRTIKAGITLGDINGIGPEVVIRAFADSAMTELVTPVIYGSGKALAHYKKTVQGGENFQFTSIANAKEARTKRINLIEIEGDHAVEPGRPSDSTGKFAVASLRRAVDDLREGVIDFLVTAPFNKETVYGEKFPYKGHTDFLAAELGGNAQMIMCSEAMKVALATVHIPLSEVSASLTSGMIVEHLRSLRQCMTADFGIVEPKIAVLALNPHSGDNGLLGTEESGVITPAILEANESGVLAFGPFAADGFFASAGFEKYDAVLAMYHDQGLAPFKALTPDGVNYTAGLSHVRTSPDHGTAYDIAGQGVADPASMRNAIYLAIDIWNSRRRYAEMTKNPLPHFERERAGKDLSVKDLIPESEIDD